MVGGWHGMWCVLIANRESSNAGIAGESACGIAVVGSGVVAATGGAAAAVAATRIYRCKFIELDTESADLVTIIYISYFDPICATSCPRSYAVPFSIILYIYTFYF